MNRHGTKCALARLALLALVAGCASLPPGGAGLEPHRAMPATRSAEAAAPVPITNAVASGRTSITSVRPDNDGYWTLTRETMP
jgi:hypothetical protein